MKFERWSQSNDEYIFECMQKNFPLSYENIVKKLSYGLMIKYSISLSLMVVIGALIWLIIFNLMKKVSNFRLSNLRCFIDLGSSFLYEDSDFTEKAIA